jgi:hypothetical protein
MITPFGPVKAVRRYAEKAVATMNLRESRWGPRIESQIERRC